MQTFCYESISSISNLCRRADYLFTTDLKSGYHHIDIYPDFWKYLGFYYDGCYHYFSILPFGLATTCYVSTKVMKQLVKRWRFFDICTIPYLDDFFFTCHSIMISLKTQGQVLSNYELAGLLIAKKKCQLGWKQETNFLGFMVNTLIG